MQNKLDLWKRWEPQALITGKYEINSIVDSDQGLFLHLSRNSFKVVIHFENSVYAFRKTEETFRQIMIHDLSIHFEKKFYAEWTFFKVENSSYIQWLEKQSGGLAGMFSIQHFVFLGLNSIVDVAVTYEPKIIVSEDN